MQEALNRVRRAGYRVVNVDSTLILEAPKIIPHAPAIQKRVAELLGVNTTEVGIKAKTPEGMGTGNAAIAHVIVLLTKGKGRGLRRKKATAEIPQKVVDEVAKKVIEQASPRAKH